MGKVNYLRVSAVKKLVKELGRRSGKEFIEELDGVVGKIVEGACEQESKKKTLEASVVRSILNSFMLGVEKADSE